MKRLPIATIALLLVSALPAHAANTLDDYLCLSLMRSAMKAQDVLAQADKDLEAQSPYRLSTASVGNWTINGDNMIVYTPDTRTEEQRLEDDYKALESRRIELHERRSKEARWARLKEQNLAQHADATVKWNEAKQFCWTQ